MKRKCPLHNIWVTIVYVGRTCYNIRKSTMQTAAFSRAVANNLYQRLQPLLYCLCRLSLSSEPDNDEFCCFSSSVLQAGLFSAHTGVWNSETLNGCEELYNELFTSDSFGLEKKWSRSLSPGLLLYLIQSCSPANYSFPE